MTVKEAFWDAKGQLEDAGVIEAELDAKYLLMEVAALSSVELFFGADRELDEGIFHRYQMAVKRRAAREPLQYITGTQEFMGISFLVSPSVLIPRQDTERLVELALPHCAGARVLDLCTGSGCILLSLAKLGGLKSGIGTDLSVDALSIAEKNAERLGVSVRFLVSDLFENVEGTFDVIVSNPPYIRTGEINKLMPEVRDFEPRMALDGDLDGLCFYRRIVSDVGAYLRKGGRIFLEIGYDQAREVCSMLKENGFGEITVKQDYAGLDRVVCGQFLGK
ncbi:MAG: peptide chain release factor N(5)-glutamine methyltransferase [Lachnospiraceae bacterium]|nr:peptide chain release factor N(5)-glutamine methyltransferase [Lachnospiraceae bacterium]